MKDSVLKKEFKQSDVQRLRNLIKGNASDSTKTQVGFSKEMSDIHKEDDIWEEDGKKWTIKNGIKRNITQLDKIKKIVSIPTFCPECNKFLNHSLDKKMYIFNGKCLDCVSKFETELKRLGKYEEYEKDKLKSNIKAYIDDLESQFHAFLNEKITFMSEQGDSEDWIGDIDHEKTVNEFNEYIASLKSQFNID